MTKQKRGNIPPLFPPLLIPVPATCLHFNFPEFYLKLCEASNTEDMVYSYIASDNTICMKRFSFNASLIEFIYNYAICQRSQSIKVVPPDHFNNFRIWSIYINLLFCNCIISANGTYLSGNFVVCCHKDHS